MTDRSPARWQQIERRYHEALEHDTERRAAFLDETCRGDDELKREVESLLGFERAAGGFLERPALADAAQEIARDARPRLTGRRLGGYDVAAPLGMGGMGEVYRARDVRLGREVALKVLEPSIAADPLYLKRFEEEAQSASVLNHPNIVTIYGVGEGDGIAFIAMELVQGRTLRDYMTAEPLPIKDAIDIAAQMAGALTAAHASGIVHRDLKPENVMVTPEGLVKVLDFGIAKRQGQVRQPARVEGTELRTTGTQAGSILGTVGYMSPEQAAGQPATFASDQFSFGAILYEMLSGRRAFQRDSKIETLAAIIGGAPPPVETLNSRVPAAVRRVLKRCLAKVPEARYPTSRDLESELLRIKGTLMPGISRRQALWFGAATAAAAVTGVSTWGFWPLPTLAVLPFSHAAHDDDIDYLCIGLTENLISRLKDLPISVKHFSLVSNFAETTLGPREVGRQLGVGMVLTGRVKVEGTHTLISAELINIATGASLWNGSYDRASADIFAIWDAIAEAVVDDGLHLRLSRDEKLKLISRPTKNPEAYTSFLRARPFQMGDRERDYLAAVDLLQDAVARDPGFAEAYLALGTSYAILAGDGYMSPRAARLMADRFHKKAEELNPSLPDLHFVRAGRSFRDGDWPHAEREWRIASAAPDKDIQPELSLGYARALWAMGRPKDSLEIVRRIRRMDPICPLFMINEADYLFASGQLDAAARMYRVAIHANENDRRPRMGLAEVFRAQGLYDAAIAARRKAHELNRDDENETFSALLATATGQAGYEEIEKMAIVRFELPTLERREASGRYVASLDFARVYARLGEADKAFSYLDAAILEQSPALAYLNVDRAWDRIRADSRFPGVVQHVNILKRGH